jgi:hypothetical protein
MSVNPLHNTGRSKYVTDETATDVLRSFAASRGNGSPARLGTGGAGRSNISGQEYYNSFGKHFNEQVEAYVASGEFPAEVVNNNAGLSESKFMFFTGRSKYVTDDTATKALRDFGSARSGVQASGLANRGAGSSSVSGQEYYNAFGKPFAEQVEAYVARGEFPATFVDLAASARPGRASATRPVTSGSEVIRQRPRTANLSLPGTRAL